MSKGERMSRDQRGYTKQLDKAKEQREALVAQKLVLDGKIAGVDKLIATLQELVPQKKEQAPAAEEEIKHVEHPASKSASVKK